MVGQGVLYTLCRRFLNQRKSKRKGKMLTKMLIITGVSVASVVAMFVMGHFLDKNAAKKERDAAMEKKSEEKEA